MDTILLQDWITLVANGTITQGADSWIDVSDYEDLVIYLEVKLFASTLGPGILMNYQTAPNYLDSDFITIASFAPAVGLRTDSFLASYATVPIAKYFRWQLTSNDGGHGTATFRAWAAGYSLR
jgi:hypothetical protein